VDRSLTSSTVVLIACIAEPTVALHETIDVVDERCQAARLEFVIYQSHSSLSTFLFLLHLPLFLRFVMTSGGLYYILQSGGQLTSSKRQL